MYYAFARDLTVLIKFINLFVRKKIKLKTLVNLKILKNSKLTSKGNQ